MKIWNDSFHSMKIFRIPVHRMAMIATISYAIPHTHIDDTFNTLH